MEIIYILFFLFAVAASVGVGLLLTAMIRAIVNSIADRNIKAFSKGLLKIYGLSIIFNFFVSVVVIFIRFAGVTGDLGIGLSLINFIVSITITVLVINKIDSKKA